MKEWRSALFATTSSIRQVNYPKWLVELVSINSTASAFRNGFNLVIKVNVHYVSLSFYEFIRVKIVDENFKRIYIFMKPQKKNIQTTYSNLFIGAKKKSILFFGTVYWNIENY